MRVEGLEPPCLAASDPKSDTSTSFATPAFGLQRYYFFRMFQIFWLLFLLFTNGVQLPNICIYCAQFKKKSALGSVRSFFFGKSEPNTKEHLLPLASNYLAAGARSLIDSGASKNICSKSEGFWSNSCPLFCASNVMRSQIQIST